MLRVYVALMFRWVTLFKWSRGPWRVRDCDMVEVNVLNESTVARPPLHYMFFFLLLFLFALKSQHKFESKYFQCLFWIRMQLTDLCSALSGFISKKNYWTAKRCFGEKIVSFDSLAAFANISIYEIGMKLRLMNSYCSITTHQVLNINWEIFTVKAFRETIVDSALTTWNACDQKVHRVNDGVLW